MGPGVSARYLSCFVSMDPWCVVEPTEPTAPIISEEDNETSRLSTILQTRGTVTNQSMVLDVALIETLNNRRSGSI